MLENRTEQAGDKEPGRRELPNFVPRVRLQDRQAADMAASQGLGNKRGMPQKGTSAPRLKLLMAHAIVSLPCQTPPVFWEHPLPENLFSPGISSF